MARRPLPKPPDLFNYLDFKTYLKDHWQFLKHKKDFNLRVFADKAEIKAPGYLKMVINGQRTLTAGVAEKFCKALELEGRTRKFFMVLVRYNQEDDPDKKKELFNRLAEIRPPHPQHVLEKHRHHYLSRDIYSCIREMVLLHDFSENPEWIAARIYPPVQPGEVVEALDALLALGLLKRDENGRLSQAESFVKTEDRNASAIEAYHFHDAVIHKARKALADLKQEERNFYALTIPMPVLMVEEIVKQFYILRDWVVDKVNQEGLKYEEVFQMNFQFFPLTRKDKE